MFKFFRIFQTSLKTRKMNFFPTTENVSWRDFTLNLKESTQKHLADVYGNLAMMLGITSIGIYLENAAIISISPFLASIACICSLLAFHFTARSENSKYLIYAFSIFQGFALGPLISMYAMVNPSLLLTATISTALLFGCFTMSALYSTDRKVSTMMLTGMFRFI